METWFLTIVTICSFALLKAIFNIFFPSSSTHSTAYYNLPPGPKIFPIIGKIIWLRYSFADLESIIRSFRNKLGPVITLHLTFPPTIFIADHSLAHQALFRNGAVVANRPKVGPTGQIVNCNYHNITSSFYGPIWRLLRRNLLSEILHPSRVKSYSHARRWVLQILLGRLQSQSKFGKLHVQVGDHFQFAMLSLLALMCFGDKLGEKQIEEIERVELASALNPRKFNTLNFWPAVTKILLRKRWEEFFKLIKDREEVFIPLIKVRKKLKEERQSMSSNKNEEDDEHVLSYVDTLLELELPDEKRNLNDNEVVALCHEFIVGGTDNTATALEWTMANLVKYPHIQEKVFKEIKEVIGNEQKEIEEDDLKKMPYLKAVVLEGLRRHPPAHFVLPHAVSEDVALDKYSIPKNTTLNFMIAEMGWDPKVWEDPMEFKPERFISKNGDETFDITGSKEIKMIPFGAGRRICPAYGLAMLHLEFYVANLVWNFEWKKIDGDDVDLTETGEVTIVMKNPLQVQLLPRSKN